MSRLYPRALSLLFILASSGIVQWVLRPYQFAGPDTAKFLEIASKQFEAGFWQDPLAFDGNYWSIGYPTFLAVIKSIYGNSTASLQLVNLTLGLILILFTWLISARLGSFIQVVATCLVAFSPNFWGLSALGGYEALLGVLVVGATFLTWRALGFDYHGGDGKRSVFVISLILFSGVLLGLAVLVQSKSFILLVVFVPYWIRGSIRSFFLGTFGLLVVLVPWSVRNYVVVGTWSPFNTNGPVNMWIGNNPGQTTGGFMGPPPIPKDSEGFVQ